MQEFAMIAVLFSRKLFVCNVYFDYKQIQEASAPLESCIFIRI